MSLEEIDVIFGGSNHVEKGGDLLHIEVCSLSFNPVNLTNNLVGCTSRARGD